jgi:hypothetical protein
MYVRRQAAEVEIKGTHALLQVGALGLELICRV